MESPDMNVSEVVAPERGAVPPDSLPVSPAFALAMAEFKLGRVAPMRAYFDLIPGLKFGVCWMCERITFLMPSGLKGWTCTECEQDHHKRGPVVDYTPTPDPNKESDK